MLLSGVCIAAEKTGVVAPGAKVEKVVSGFQFTEGAANDAAGNIYFTDIPNNRIHKWSVDGKLSTFLENSEGANGLYVDKDGNVVACAGNTGKIISVDPNGKVTVLADKFAGNPFNSPNDLWIDPNGGIYFTDPRYGRMDNLPQKGEHVYYLSGDHKRIICVTNDLVRPNGLIGTPDGKLLYIGDHGAGKIYVYTIKPDGTLADKKLFIPQGPDGMTIDSKGNIYITVKDVMVYDPSGRKIDAIPVPEAPTNVSFGGRDNQTLFITAGKSLYSVKMSVKGL
jgi:gluconolactonase